MAIIAEPQTYIPEFNIDSQKYEDKCPIPPYAKGFIYKCKCTNKGTIFTTSSVFKKHFENKEHKLFIENYLDRVKETSEYINIIKHNQIKIELLSRENEKLKKDVTQLKKTLLEKEHQFKFMNELD